MKRVMSFVFAGLCLSAAAQAPRAPISLQGDGPYYRLSLPLPVYGFARQGDLTTLRVLNAAGQAVPYAWLDVETMPPRTRTQQVPVFALERAGGDAAPADAQFELTLRPDGSIHLNGKPLAPARRDVSPANWLIDTSKVKGQLLQARFELPSGTMGVFPLQLEASEDLRQWRPVGQDEQLVRLARGGETLERLSLDLGQQPARYLRLRWVDPAHAPVLQRVDIDSVENAEPVATTEWTPAVAPLACAQDHCDYPLPRGLPLQLLRVELAQPNTLAQLQIAGLVDPKAPARPTGQGGFHSPLHALRHVRQVQQQEARGSVAALPDEFPIVHALVYRLNEGGGEARSPLLALDGNVYERLRLRTEGPVGLLGSPPPRIAIGAAPRTLVFLAQGQGPFSLDWGTAPGGPGAALAIATLMPRHQPGQPLGAGVASVALPLTAPPVVAASQAASAPEPAPKAKPWVLWAALGVALLVMAGMAVPLLKNLGKQREDENSAG